MPRHPRAVPRLLAAATVVAAVVAVTLPVSTQHATGSARRVVVRGHEAVEGEVLVKYRDRRDVRAHAWVEARASADEVETLDRRGLKRLRSRRMRTSDLLTMLDQDPDIEYAEPNYILRATTVPNDPAFGNLWGMLNSGFNPVGGGGTAGSDIDATSAWASTTGSRSAVIGVVDTGIDYTHPDLAANIWTAPSAFTVTVGGQVITCQAGTHGFNAITRTCNPMDDQYHGTHVAGTIGAVGNNGVGVAGVNWTTSMMGLKFLGSNGSGSTSDAIAAIEFAVQAKAAFAATSGANVRVLSNSWGGGGFSTALRDVILAANAADILFVAAAGNSHLDIDASPSYPASYATANMVAVASTDSADRLSSFSNYGDTSVHLAAPGTAIYSTMPNRTYSTLNGPSMATPHVSGAAMLALARCQLTTAELKSLLLGSVDVVAALATATSTGGRLNVARALASCASTRVSGLTLTPSHASPEGVGRTITWTAVASGGQEPYQYQFLTFDGLAWSAATAWSDTNTFAWTPAVVKSTYQVAVRARSAWNSGAAEKTATRPFVVEPVMSSVTLKPGVKAPQGTGASVTWTATGKGGVAPYQYQWLVYNGSTWSAPTGWSSSPTFTWTPSTASNATQVMARARSAWNDGTFEVSASAAYAVKPYASSVSLSPSLASPQVRRTAITWTAMASGGEAPYKYQWLVHNGTAWSSPSGWSARATYAWKPTLPGTYQIAVRVRGGWNKGAAEATTSGTFTVR